MFYSVTWGCFTLKTPLKWSQLAITTQNKMSNNTATVRDKRNVSMNHDNETGVALSHSVNTTCVKRPLAEKSRWRHIRLAIKPRYLGNHASQMKSYYGTLSGSYGRSFRMRHEKSPKALHGGKLTMTSYPACNKTSLSRKPCISDKKLLLITIRKSWSLIQNPSWKIARSVPWRRTDDDVMSDWQ